jgi:hypothetical protein
MIFKTKLVRVNSRLNVENSSNLVTLLPPKLFFVACQQNKKQIKAVLCSGGRVARWFVFKPKIQIWVNF